MSRRRRGRIGGVTLEVITKPLSDDNDVELESELKLYWLEGEQTGGWLSSHFDIVDKLSGAHRPRDKRAYTHKLTSSSTPQWRCSAGCQKRTGCTM
ncbi:MAG TPA: hypothetical protein VM115_05740 [Vicinamibacterales bacterium]|nr:hypothetical protein [Vicinamibacterales bacterium]